VHRSANGDQNLGYVDLLIDCSSGVKLRAKASFTVKVSSTASHPAFFTV
jgi:hypothetical protein